MVSVHYPPLRKFNDMFGDNVTRAACVSGRCECAGGMMLFIRWRVAAERRAGSRSERGHDYLGFVYEESHSKRTSTRQQLDSPDPARAPPLSF
jgi:hypothetical protein